MSRKNLSMTPPHQNSSPYLACNRSPLLDSDVDVLSEPDTANHGRCRVHEFGFKVLEELDKQIV